jgi:hypothetical protein
MEYLPAVVVGVVGLLAVVALVMVVLSHLRRTAEAADVLRAAMAEAMVSLRRARRG